MRLIANLWPHPEPRQSPIATAAQQAETTDIRMTAHKPIRMRESCARGLSRHSGSRKLPGRRSDTLDVKLRTAPTRKKILSPVMPRGRISDSFIIPSCCRMRQTIAQCKRHLFLSTSRRFDRRSVSYKEQVLKKPFASEWMSYCGSRPAIVGSGLSSRSAHSPITTGESASLCLAE